MGDHVVLNVDRLVKPPEAAGPSSSAADNGKAVAEEEETEDQPLITVGDCRICQEEDSIKNLETPCACSGSLKYAHRKCVQHWCSEKGDITCEICHKPYQPGYTAPPRSPPEETAIDIGGGWMISGTPLDLNDPRLLAIAETERYLLEAEYDDYADTNASGAAFCRSSALILMALLLLRHALSVPDDDGDDDASTFFSSGFGGCTRHKLMALLLLRHALSVPDDDGDDDASTFFSLFLLRSAGFLLPCYIMAWAISMLQRRRQRQEAAAMAATQFAFVVQSGQARGLHFTIASAPPATPH